MNSIGNKIFETRKSKGLTQEELAELSKVNLRTIQRIENDENEPRGKTLSLICDVLEINRDDFINKTKQSKVILIGTSIVNGVFLIIINIILMSIIGYMTLDSNANLNSRVGAFLLSFLLPFFIVFLTQRMKPLERMLKFGTGFILYSLMIFTIHGLQEGFRAGFTTGLFLCLIVSVGVLYYGDVLLKSEKRT